MTEASDNPCASLFACS